MSARWRLRGAAKGATNALHRAGIRFRAGLEFAGGDEDEGAVAVGPGEGGGLWGRAAGCLGELFGEAKLAPGGGSAPDGGESADGDEGEEQFEGDRQGSDGASDGDAKRFPRGSVGDGFDAVLERGGAGEIELLGGGLEEFGFAAARFDEGDVPGGFGDGDRESRGAATSADVDEGLPRRGGRAEEVKDVSPANEGFDDEAVEEGFGVLDGGEAEVGVGLGEGLEVSGEGVGGSVVWRQCGSLERIPYDGRCRIMHCGGIRGCGWVWRIAH